MPFNIYKSNVKIDTDTISGEAGLAINDNFRAIADSLESMQTSLNGKAKASDLTQSIAAATLIANDNVYVAGGKVQLVASGTLTPAIMLGLNNGDTPTAPTLPAGTAGIYFDGSQIKVSIDGGTTWSNLGSGGGSVPTNPTFTGDVSIVSRPEDVDEDGNPTANGSLNLNGGQLLNVSAITFQRGNGPINTGPWPTLQLGRLETNELVVSQLQIPSPSSGILPDAIHTTAGTICYLNGHFYGVAQNQSSGVNEWKQLDN